MGFDQRINILMVDDSPTNLLALESILAGPDRNLVSASSGDDALRYLLDNEVAVILMDVYMPGLDGLDTAELIRTRERSRDIPIIFLTADSTGGRHLSRGYSLGAVDYIVKPVEPDILRSKVAVFVELFKQTQEIKRQALLLHQKNLELENLNLNRLGMLIQLGQELAAEHEPGQVLEMFCRSARTIVGAEEAAVRILGVDNGSGYHFRCGEAGETWTAGSDSDVPQAVIDTVARERRTLRLTEFDEMLRSIELSRAPRSFLAAPLHASSRVCGLVYLINKFGADEFSEADERLVVTLSTQVGIAYENAKLYSDAQRHAEELQAEIAERKLAEQEVAKLLVSEQAARAEAEQANRTKDEFLATLSHELRTPLSAILGWTHLVRTGKLDPPQTQRAFETIERNARSQSQLIDDLLDVSRIITGKLQIELKPVELTPVVETAFEAVRPAFEAKHIDFQTVCDSPSCVVLGDANRLQQVLWNLFSNAVKFTPHEGKVRVTVRRFDPAVSIIVQDSGVGIKKDFIPFIFDRFRQADGSTTRAHGGLGLGLSIVKHLVQLHQGNVEVESKGEDRGSIFKVTLPLASAMTASKVDDAESNELDSNGHQLHDSHLLEGLRVLVVDDEADTRELVTAILTRSGGQVKCSESAAEAIRDMKTWDPDVLVSDIGMPREDGYSLIKKLRRSKTKRARQIPAIALTAYATDEDRIQALSAGFQVHVAKPIEAQVLVKSIAALTGRRN
jgi:signal transduction histidine kinase/DNA-binding response OmpR family regulator